MKYIMMGLCAFILFANILSTKSFGEEYTYRGMYNCTQCHAEQGELEKSADPYGVWIHSRHSQAYASLTQEERQNDECLACHTTAYGVDASRLGSRFKIEDGVQCEACHGPGNKYSLAMMEMGQPYTRELGLANGLVIPTEEVCVQCHNDRSPHWNLVKDPPLEDAGPRVGFNYTFRLRQIRHDNTHARHIQDDK